MGKTVGQTDPGSLQTEMKAETSNTVGPEWSKVGFPFGLKNNKKPWNTRYHVQTNIFNEASLPI